MSEYHRHVKEVLKHLCKTGLYTKAEKCEFHSELVEYLEYCYDSKLKDLSNELTLVLSDTRELDRVPNTK